MEPYVYTTDDGIWLNKMFYEDDKFFMTSELTDEGKQLVLDRADEIMKILNISTFKEYLERLQAERREILSKEIARIQRDLSNVLRG